MSETLGIRAGPPTPMNGVQRASGVPYWAVIAIILITTAATRFSAFGNPTYSGDDPVFLLIGQAILDGEMPYVDIWDRKPIGIFLIFSAIRLLGGEGILQSQVIAGLFAATTAITVERICRYFTSQPGSLAAALVYLLFLPAFRGAAAQVNIFYNLFMALSALLVVRAICSERPPSLRSCVAAMLLCGLSITVKQTTAFEGCLFGAALVIVGCRRGWSARRAFALAALMVIVALLPTLITFVAFAALGHFYDYWFAAFESIGFRSADSPRRVLWRLFFVTIYSLPLLIAAAGGAAERARQLGKARKANPFIIAWLAVAALGFAIVPRGYDYYFIPVLVPLAVSGSTLFGRQRLGLGVFASICIFVVAQGAVVDRSEGRTANAEYRAMAAVVQDQLQGGCLFVATGPPALYLTTNACRSTPYVFPGHLIDRKEEKAIPVDGLKEMARILGTRPQVIIFDRFDDREFRYQSNVGLLKKVLSADYRRAGSFETRIGPGKIDYDVWVRRVDADRNSVGPKS